MNLNLAGITLHVTDVDRSLAFYKQFPGASVMFHMSGIFALLQIGNGRLGLIADQKRKFHVEIDCPDLDTAYARFQELGVAKEGPPSVKLWGERDFMLLDPDGNLVECGQQKNA